MTVPVPLTDDDSHTIDVGPVWCPTCKREYGNTEAEALREALRIAVEGLNEAAEALGMAKRGLDVAGVHIGHDITHHNESSARAALAAVRELVDLGGDDE